MIDLPIPKRDPRCERGTCTHDLVTGLLIDDIVGPDDGPHATTFGQALLDGLSPWWPAGCPPPLTPDH